MYSSIPIQSCSYLVRPSPFSAQKTFERHNSRRKSNISFCSQQLVQQMAASSQAGSRRGSGLGLSGYTAPRPPPLVTTKANSLSLPDSPTVVGGSPGYRGRSNSLRVVDDILLRRSNSLRQGLASVGSGRRKSSLEDLGVAFAGVSHPANHNPIKIALNGSIGLEVTPPDEGSTPSVSSSCGLLNSGPSGLRVEVGVDTSANGGASGGGLCSGVAASGGSDTCSAGLDISGLGGCNGENCLSTGQVSTIAQGTVTDPQHLQGTLVWYHLMWGRRLSSVVRNKWLWTKLLTSTSLFFQCTKQLHQIAHWPYWLFEDHQNNLIIALESHFRLQLGWEIHVSSKREIMRIWDGNSCLRIFYLMGTILQNNVGDSWWKLANLLINSPFIGKNQNSENVLKLLNKWMKIEV